MKLEFRAIRGRGEFAGNVRLEPMTWLTPAEVTQLLLQGVAEIKLWDMQDGHLTAVKVR